MDHRKILPGIALVAMMCFLGFVVGAFVGAFFVPAGSGLAGGAIVFWYGVLGGAIAFTLGCVLAVRLPRPRLVRALWLALAGVLVAVAVAVLFFRYQSV